MPGEDLAADLARYAHELEYDDVDDEAVAVGKRRLVDALACALAAEGEPSVGAPFVRRRKARRRRPPLER